MFNKFCFMNPPRTHEIADCRFRWDPWGPWDPWNFVFFFSKGRSILAKACSWCVLKVTWSTRGNSEDFRKIFWWFLIVFAVQNPSNIIKYDRKPILKLIKKLPICASIISNHWHPSKKRDEKQSRVPAIPRPKEPTSGTLHSEDSSIWQTDSATKTPIKQLKQSAISFWLTK